MDIHDFTSSFTVGYADFDFSVKATGSSQGWVECVSSVGGTDDNDVVSTLHTVHEREHLRNNTSFNFARYVFTLGANGVDFVDEDDRWRICRCFVKYFSKLLF